MSKVNDLAAKLIAHAGTQYVDADKTWLETLSEEQLEKMVPKEVAAPQANAEQLSPEDKSALEFGKAQLKAHRDGLIQKINANTAAGVWEPSVLNSMPNSTLESIVKSIPEKEEPVTGVYVGGGVVANSASEEAMYPAGIEVK